MATKRVTRGRGVTVLASAARTTSSNSGTLRDTTAEIPNGSAVSLYLNVTAHTGDDAGLGSGGLQVYFDTSYDGGTTWLNVGKFQRVTTSTATLVMNMRSGGIGAVEAASHGVVFSTTAASAAIVNNCVWGRDVRLSWTLGNGTNATVTPSATFAVFAGVQGIDAGPQ